MSQFIDGMVTRLAHVRPLAWVLLSSHTHYEGIPPICSGSHCLEFSRLWILGEDLFHPYCSMTWRPGLWLNQVLLLDMFQFCWYHLLVCGNWNKAFSARVNVQRNSEENNGQSIIVSRSQSTEKVPGKYLSWEWNEFEHSKSTFIIRQAVGDMCACCN